jgi:hypothetical protein
MARAPMAAIDAAAAFEEPMVDADAAEAGPVTICTVMKNPDGSFSLQGAAPTAMEGEAAAEPAAPQTFDSAGPLLNAINDLLEGATGAEGDPRQQAFMGGYGAGPSGTPTR